MTQLAINDTQSRQRMRIICDLNRSARSRLQLVAQAGQFGFEKLAVVKRAAEGQSGDAIPAQRLLLEAHLSAGLNHPNLVHTYACATDESGPFLVMEYLPGQSLGALLSELTLDRAGVLLMIKVLIAVLEGLDSVHMAQAISGEHLGLVHRGVTWDNVQITYDGRVKLVDFGSASCFKCSFPHHPEDEELRFCAPEIVRTGLGDHRSDVYSVGVMLWELCAGEQFYESLTGKALRHLLSRDTPVVPPPITIPPPWLPAAIHGVCAHALAFDPNQRYAGARNFRKDLCTLLREMGETDLDCSDALRSQLAAHFSEPKLTLEAQVASAVRAPFLADRSSTSQLHPPASSKGLPTSNPWAPVTPEVRAPLPAIPLAGSRLVDHGPLPGAHLITRRVARCAQQATSYTEQTKRKGSADARLTRSRVSGGGASPSCEMYSGPHSPPPLLPGNEEITDESPSISLPLANKSSKLIRWAIGALALFTVVALATRASRSSREGAVASPHPVQPVAIATPKEGSPPPTVIPESPPEPPPELPGEAIQLEELEPEEKPVAAPPTRKPPPRTRSAPRTSVAASPKNAAPPQQDLKLSRSISWD